MALLVPSTAQADGNSTGGWTPGETLSQSSGEVSSRDELLATYDNELVQWGCVGPEQNPCPSIPDSKAVDLTHVAQSTWYYCGPAAGTMILRSTNEGASAYNGESLTQDHVADDAHTKTASLQVTAWASGNFRRGLNRWRGDTAYSNLEEPTTKKFTSALHGNIKRNKPFGVSTIEFKNGLHYNGHPDMTLGHWIVAYGWADKLATIRFADPAAGSDALPAYADAAKKFNAGLKWFNQNFFNQAGHGITF
ncbi:C39 family peptidase [Nocardioides acrostichi]|uniref:C39 family peptidase n=1 Tax=Nocardioides acrostichi TaxID=2784339 RepID=A0A930UWL0_9ACTN|nr:C39 family peptidase [Nocardioides acrostichi]MBF4162198.1 C39 family peptidase [Nocardioides acrostichi]